MLELALPLIEENKKTRDIFLDLRNCGLTEVPGEIGELVWLEELSLSNSDILPLSNEWLYGSRRETQNVGPANHIRRLTSSMTGLPGVIKFFPSGVGTNPFSRLKNLKRLWLKSDDEKRSGLTDLTPLAVLSSLQKLDISGTGIDDLTPLAGLTNLQELHVSGTRVVDLLPLARLKKLRMLSLRRTLAFDLRPLAGLEDLQSLDIGQTKVANLLPLAVLTGLQSLDVRQTPVTDLGPLAGLESLQRLYLVGTKITDLNPLTGLARLQSLDVSETPVANLNPLAGLAGLKSLDVSETPVADLMPLVKLADLQILDIRHTQITDLSPMLPLIRQGIPVKWVARFWEEQGIFVQGCSFINPPTEVVRRGNASILNYFIEKEAQGFDHLYEAKLLIVGQPRAGKTSFLRRLCQPGKPLPKERETTKGIDIHRHEFKLANGRHFRLNVWDFGGQEIYHATHQFFLTKRSLYVLLDDTLNNSKTVQDEGFKYWLEVVDQLSEHSPVVIFQNERGGRSKTIGLAEIKSRFDNVKECYQGNLEHADAVDKLREDLEFFAQKLPHIGEELPACWVSIRAEIEAEALYKPYISQQDYFNIYAKYLEFNREKALHLSRYFHDLGVFLHFQDDMLLAKSVILQNTWATEAVFKILDDEIIKKDRGHFSLRDCQRVWKDSIYADMHAELLALMQNFELCYRLPDAKPDTWLAPQLLPPSKPSDLVNWEQPGDLALRYRYKFMPKGLISRLIVRQHCFVPKSDLGWVTGVLFERDGTEVLAEIPPEGGEIALRARGPERKELLSVIAADLDALNDSFHGLRDRVEKLVPCICSKCRCLAIPEYFEKKRLLQRREDKKLKVECPSSYEDVDVLELLDGIRVNHLPIWAKGESAVEKQKRIFICYSKADDTHKNNLLKHLSGLRDKIATWNDTDLLPGEDWNEKIKEELEKADIVLYLVSRDSMATEYIQTIELPLIEARCQKGDCKLVPVIVRSCDWTTLDFAKYNALPDKDKPVTSKKHWDDEDEAWLKVVEGVKRLVDAFKKDQPL